LLSAYTLACMEYDRFPGLGNHFDAAHPTYHMLRFVELFMKDPKAFITPSAAQRLVLERSSIATLIKKCAARPMWRQVIKDDTQAVIDFMYPGGMEQIHADSKKAPRSRKHGKAKAKSKAAAPTPVKKSDAGLGFGMHGDNLTYDETNIRPLLNNNVFLKALVEPMPGVYSGVTLTFEDGLADIGDLGNALDLDANDIEDIEDEGGVAEVDPDDGCVLFAEAVNISTMISEREARILEYINAAEDDVTDEEDEGGDEGVGGGLQGVFRV
jgi:hypothetical protein